MWHIIVSHVIPTFLGILAALGIGWFMWKRGTTRLE